MRRQNLVFSLIIILYSFTTYAYNKIDYYLEPMEMAKNAMQVKVNDTIDIISTDKYYAFIPKVALRSRGYLMYTGGFIDPIAYAPMLRYIAEQGYTTVIVRSPFNTAIIKPIEYGEFAINALPEVQEWIVGGHSLGGVAAAKLLLHGKSKSILGIFNLASQPQEKDSLVNFPGPTALIYGSKDPFTTKDFQSIIALYPHDLVITEIKGGNHAQMGYYGGQLGDNNADIAIEIQQNQLRQALLNFLETAK